MNEKFDLIAGDFVLQPFHYEKQLSNNTLISILKNE